MLKKVLFYLTFLCFFVTPAYAWDQAFESHTNDLALTDFVTSGSAYSVSSVDHGVMGYLTAGGSYTTNGFVINKPYTGYLGFSAREYNGDSQKWIYTKLQFLDSSNNVLWTSNEFCIAPGYDPVWRRFEVYTDGAFIKVMKDNSVIQTTAYTSGGVIPAKMRFIVSGSNYGINHGGIDDFTTSSSHAMIGMDSSASVTDAGQYYRVGTSFVSGKTYRVAVFSPNYTKVYEHVFTTQSDLLAEQLIPAANISKVGQYTTHLYRVDSSSSETYLTMKSFNVVDPASTGEGDITLEKTEYETGDTVGAWVHLVSYAPGYKISCDFPTAGSNFKKTVDVTANPFYGSFTIPDISTVVGVHTVYLLNPSGKVVDSADFNAYVPGLPDIAFDRDQYERTDKAYIYYKDVKDNSKLSVTLRYGGTTADTLEYSISKTGSIKLDLSSLAAADSIYAVIRDSDGYANDQDNAKIMIGNFVLTGRVYDAKSGAAISGASVTVQGNVTNSDTSGNYNLTALAGFANYSVSATGYNGITGTVAVFDLETIHNFYMSPVIVNGGTGVYGTVVSSKTDYPLVGASVEVINNDNSKRFSTIVNNIGYYSLSNDDLAGNLSIRVSFNNYDSIVATSTVSSGSMQNHNFRLNAVPGYTEIDPSEHTGGQDSSDTGETAEERAYREKYGEMGKHPFDFNGDGQVENSEWKYAFERLGLLLGCLAFMGFMLIIGRRR